MLEVLDKRILLLILSLLTNTETTKLSEQKKCGDPECETAMSRVQAVRDHLGPDCRFLNFKTGEEIMVHFKLSRTREDLWAGSKGQDFGYFPVDAVQIEEVLATKEVEVPTKETDFFCLDGEEHIFENEDRVFHPYDEEVPLDTDEDGSEYVALTPRALPFGTEFPELSSDRGEVGSTVERASHGDVEHGSSQAAPGDTTQPGHARGQSLEAAHTPPAWTVSRIAGWLGLGRQQREGSAARASEAAGHLLFRHQKEAETDDVEWKLSSDAGAAGPGESAWSQRLPPNFLNLESERSGLSLLRRENDPEVPDSPPSTGQADPHSSAGAADTGKEGPRDVEAPPQNWFHLDLQDVLTFGYSSEPEAGGGKAAPKEELQPLNSQLTEATAEEDSRKPGVEESLLQEAEPTASQEAPGPGAASSAQPHTALQDAAGPSVPTEPPGKQPQSHSTAQDSAADSHMTENGMEESGRRTDQSEGHVNGKTQEDNVEDSDKEKEPLDVKNKDKGLLHPPKEDFLVHDHEGDEQKSATADDEGMNPFPLSQQSFCTRGSYFFYTPHGKIN